MAQDNTIPLGKPGIASFASESWGNHPDLLFSCTPAQTTQTRTVKSTAGITLVLGAVVKVDAGTGEITLAKATGTTPTNITASPVVMAAGESFDVPLFVAGHFRMQALTFDASFDTDAKKQDAFLGTKTPMILISKAKYVDDAVVI